MKQREVKVDKDCNNNCKFKCHQNVSAEARKTIFNHFWSLDELRKSHFYSANTQIIIKKTKRTKSIVSRRHFSFAYYLHVQNVPIRVCKQFFPNTLDISQRRISYFYEHFQTTSCVPTPRKQGKHTKKVISQCIKDGVREHIDSIPAVDSHYCRANSTCKYFESELSISRLYELYLKKTLIH